MSAIFEGIENKRVSRIENAIRRRQIREVKLYMKKIFNPIYYNTKPRYRKSLTPDEQAFVNTALKNIYNPKVRHNVFDELGAKRIAET